MMTGLTGTFSYWPTVVVWTCGDLVDDVEALGDLAEDGVAGALLVGVEHAVVDEVEEELGGGAVGIGGAGHGDRAAQVLEAAGGRFVGDGRVVGDFGHVGLEAAALDHEAGNDAVEDGAVVGLLVHVAEEVGDGLGRLFGVELRR